MIKIPECSYLVVQRIDFFVNQTDELTAWVDENIKHPYWFMGASNFQFFSSDVSDNESEGKMICDTGILWGFSDYNESLLFELRWK